MSRFRAHLTRFRLDLLLVAAFFLAGALLARGVLSLPGRPIFFYQDFFGASVLDACGMGFHEFRQGDAPRAFTEFMERRRGSLSCDELPRDLPLEPAAWQARMHRYLAASLTTVWRIRGVSWSVLGPLFEIACGLVAALAYALGRLALNRFWAGAVAAGIVLSPLNLSHVPFFRDYSKAPFLLASLLVCSLIVTRGTSRRRLIWLSLANGAIVGIGLGFRTDILLAVPLFVLAILFFLPPVPKGGWLFRPAALGAFLVAFVLAGWPVVRAYSQGSNSSHVMLLGFAAQPFNTYLGLAPADYVITPSLWDFQTEVQVRAYTRATGGDDWATVTPEPYGAAASRYLRDLAILVPADLVVRTYAAVLTSFRLPSSPSAKFGCELIATAFAGKACTAHNTLFTRLQPLVLPSVVLAVVLLAGASIRLAGFLCAAVLVLAGVTMLEFEPRHAFHLEVLSLIALACAAQAAVTAALNVRHRNGIRDAWTDPVRRRQVVRGMGAALVLLVVPAFGLWVMRQWQQRSFEPVFDRYLAADPVALPITWLDGIPGVARVDTDAFLPPIDPATWQDLSLRAEIMRMELGGPACRGREVVITRQYRTTFGPTVLTIPAEFRAMTPVDDTTTLVFFPIYRALVGRPSDPAPWGTFDAPGIDLRPDDVPCVRSLARLLEPDAFPLQLAVTIPTDWRRRPHYQVMMQLGGRP
jgi:hypothetical protein